LPALFVALVWAVACGRAPDAAPTIEPATVAPTAEVVAPTAEAAATSTPPVVIATREGAGYVLLLPRESALPGGWVMSPAPDYEARRPAAGETYRFTCADLPARSVGRASVGYRHLEGLPSVQIEYVIYATDDDAADALADMEAAADRCAEFTLGEGEGATTAAFAALDFPPYGDGGFARTLATNSPATGELTTHMIKVRRGHVVIGVNHANYSDGDAPDGALTESLVALAVNNLRGGPVAPGR